MNQEQQGVEAERILTSEVYQEAFDAVEKTITDALKSAPMDSDADLARVLNLVRRLQSHAGAKRWMDNQMQYGRLAESQRESDNILRKKGLFNRGGL